MVSALDYGSSASVWAQDKWKGQFRVKWIYVKDVPNSQLRHIKLENNENKPVTNSRDTQEVLHEPGKAVLKIISTYRHTTSIFDDFMHYEQRQQEEHKQKVTDDDSHRRPAPHRPSDKGERGNDRGDRGNDRDRAHYARDGGGDRNGRGDRNDRSDREPRDHRNTRDRRDLR